MKLTITLKDGPMPLEAVIARLRAIRREDPITRGDRKKLRTSDAVGAKALRELDKMGVIEIR